MKEKNPMPHKSLEDYLVKPGDTIGKLAKRFHCTEEQICRWNKIRLTDPLLVGQKLVLRF